MSDIKIIHEEIFDLLLQEHEQDNNFLFMPRRINNSNRLSNGFWFIGNDDYLNISFWEGTDKLEKIHNLGFYVKKDGRAYIDISSKDHPDKALALKKLIDKLGGFKQIKENKWQRFYDNNNYIQNIKSFLKETKPIIDDFIKNEKPQGISFIKNDDFKKYIKKINDIRMKNTVSIPNISDDKPELNNTQIMKSEKTLNEDNYTQNRPESIIEVDPIHKKMQNAICKILKKD